MGSYSKDSDYDPGYGDDEPDDGPSPDDMTPAAAVADYLTEMIGQLEDIARRSQLDLLVYLLSMAKSEAQAHAQPAPAPRARSA